MNSSHNNGGSNGTLHNDLEQISRDYKNMGGQEPPELLDQAVLSAAHRAVEKKPGWMQFGWLHGLTTTAVIVLAISLVWQQKNTNLAFKDAVSPNTTVPLQYKKPADSSSPPATVESTGPEIKRGQSLPSRQKMAIPESPSITQNEAEPLEKTQTQESLNEAAVAGARRVDDGVAEYRIDADKEEIPVKRVSADEMDKMADVVEEEVSQKVTSAGLLNDQRQKEQTAEEQLARIIHLKKAGDETWQAELLAFKKRFPDYPIPEQMER